jgi:hypothetical protein
MKHCNITRRPFGDRLHVCKLALALLGVSGISDASAVCFVNASAAGANSGSSWADAYTDLQSALGDPSCNETWVARGVYKPSSTMDATATFSIASGAAIYGGFAGIESDRNARAPESNPTILSGDLAEDDVNAGKTNIDESTDDIVGVNSYRVVTMNGSTPIGAGTVLDGFVITGGDAPGGVTSLNGAGLYCNGSGAGAECSPTLANLVFSGNRSGANGGAICNDGSNGGASRPTIENSHFVGNLAAASGGAIFNFGKGGEASPQIHSSVFDSNYAGDFAALTGGGGAISNSGDFGASSPIIEATTFRANHAALSGGAVVNSGFHGVSGPRFVNVTFSENTAENGGAVINTYGSPYFDNVTSSGNIANNTGGTMFNGASAHITISNSILWMDFAGDAGSDEIGSALTSATTTVDHSVIERGCPMDVSCTTISDTDPLLETIAYSYGALVMLPAIGSSAIDNGNDATCAEFDQRGFTRPQGAHCDIGAVERRFPSEDLPVPGDF